MGEVRVDGLPARFSKTPWRMTRGAPCLGEHNEEVFGRLLGLSPDEVAELRGGGRHMSALRRASASIELANERIAFAGKLLADMGADVILVEPPGGDPAPRLSAVPGRRSRVRSGASGGGTTTPASAA